MHVSIFPNGVKPAVDCCRTCCYQFHCPLCPKLKSFTRRRFARHLELHKNNALPFRDFYICRCNQECRDAGHFHCPRCDRTIIRRQDMESHVKKCISTVPIRRPPPSTAAVPALVPPSPSTTAAVLALLAPSPSTTDTPALVAPSPYRTADVPSLGAPSPSTIETSALGPPSPSTIAAVAALVAPSPSTTAGFVTVIPKPRTCKAQSEKVHTKERKDKTAHDHLKSVCVDATNGLYAVKKEKHGFSVPVHVQNKTWGHFHKVQCELEECREYHLMAVRSGLLSKHCEHIRSTQYCRDTAQEEFLKEETLTTMVWLQFFGEAKKAVCLKRQRRAEASHVPLCVPVNLQPSQRQFCFSVHEPRLNHYSCLGRLIVTYNQAENKWHCPCAKPRISCVHKNISKWHLFQVDASVFETEPAFLSTPEENETTADKQFKQLVQYLYFHKRLPENIPEHLTKPKALTDFLTELHPKETTCTFCPGSVQLGQSSNITQTARIITMSGIIENVSTYFKQCPQCHLVYRYQEWTDGLHNFDDHVVLTLEMCLYLRHNLQNSVSVSKVIDALEGLRNVRFPDRDTILHAYCHFEALTGHDYAFNCVCCGCHPPVVVMELHKKRAFNSPVSDIKEPPEEYCGEVDVENFWDMVHQDMIARGFSQSSAKNVLSVTPSFDFWAPWIGEKTRKSGVVLNTEYKKVSSSEAEVSSVSEDRLVDELLKQKVSTMRKLCKACNVDSEGSRIDLVIKLREEMKTRDSYDKIFQEVWGASGGWSVILCPHGVVYSLKFNLRAECPRDFADLLLSWRHLPNVCVYDSAGGLATHTNRRCPQSPPFQPHEGRLSAPTTENITAAQQRKLKVSLPWLTEMLDTPEDGGHPLTGSSQHYVLCDKSHDNSRDPQEVLRRIALVPELQGSLNSRVAEQLFSTMQKNSSDLNNMAPSTNIFLMRNIVHHRNNNINAKVLEQLLQRGHESHQVQDILLNDLGQAVTATESLLATFSVSMS